MLSDGFRWPCFRTGVLMVWCKTDHRWYAPNECYVAMNGTVKHRSMLGKLPLWAIDIGGTNAAFGQPIIHREYRVLLNPEYDHKASSPSFITKT